MVENRFPLDLLRIRGFPIRDLPTIGVTQKVIREPFAASLRSWTQANIFESKTYQERASFARCQRRLFLSKTNETCGGTSQAQRKSAVASKL